MLLSREFSHNGSQSGESSSDSVSDSSAVSFAMKLITIMMMHQAFLIDCILITMKNKTK